MWNVAIFIFVFFMEDFLHEVVMAFIPFTIWKSLSSEVTCNLWYKTVILIHSSHFKSGAKGKRKTVLVSFICGFIHNCMTWEQFSLRPGLDVKGLPRKNYLSSKFSEEDGTESRFGTQTDLIDMQHFKSIDIASVTHVTCYVTIIMR